MENLINSIEKEMSLVETNLQIAEKQLSESKNTVNKLLEDKNRLLKAKNSLIGAPDNIYIHPTYKILKHPNFPSGNIAWYYGNTCVGIIKGLNNG